MSHREFLEKVSIFKGLDSNQLDKVATRCSEKEFRHGDRLFIEGQTADNQWIVVDGQVDLRFDLPGHATSVKNTISSISACEPFGWSSLVDPNRYTLSAYCATRQCRVVILKRADLLDLFEKDADLGFRVMSNLANIIGRRFDHLAKSAMDAPFAMINITVHMATCGISAGAREIMTALMDEMAQVERPDIKIETKGCIGKCSTEPNVTVAIEYEDPVIYQLMTADKMRTVFQKHVLKGAVQSELVLTDP
jgi:NADP-reducing hydrogenase subunit HndB